MKSLKMLKEVKNKEMEEELEAANKKEELLKWSSGDVKLNIFQKIKLWSLKKEVFEYTPNKEEDGSYTILKYFSKAYDEHDYFKYLLLLENQLKEEGFINVKLEKIYNRRGHFDSYRIGMGLPNTPAEIVLYGGK